MTPTSMYPACPRCAYAVVRLNPGRLACLHCGHEHAPTRPDVATEQHERPAETL